MKYFFLENSGSSPATGSNFPQIQKLAPALDYLHRDSVYRLFEQGLEFNSSINPKIDYAELKKGSIASDFLSSAMFNANGFLLSEKGKDIFSTFNLPPHKFYKVPVKSGSTIISYYWLHMLFKHKELPFISLQDQNVIFEKSTFWITKYLKKIEQVQVNSLDELKRIEHDLQDGRYVEASVLFVKNEFQSTVPDVFMLPLLNQNSWIIKEKVKLDLEAGNLSGYKLTEIENLFFD